MTATHIESIVAVLCLGAVLGVVSMAVPQAVAEDFRIENKVYARAAIGTEKLASRSTTIFFGDMVFDYLDQPSEVIVFDRIGRRFVLLDTDRRVRAELSTDEVAAFTARLRASAEDHDSPFIRFLATPEFDEQFDAQQGELTLASQFVTYQLNLAPSGSEAVVAQYREFSDWLAQVNTLLRPGSNPPFARLMVNAALATYDSTAKEVHLTVTPKKTFPPTRVKLRSEHELSRSLAQGDLARVKQTQQFMAIFEQIGIEEYRKKLAE